MEEGTNNFRSEAKDAYKLGNTYSTKSGVQNLLLSIEKYKAALFNLKCIKGTQFTPEDAQMASEVLGQLIQSMNRLFRSSVEKNRILEEVDKFLVIYLNCVERFNVKEKVFPTLSGFDYEAMKVLFHNAPEKSQKICSEIYEAIVALFHSDASREKNPECESNDKLVLKAVDLYVRASELYKKTLNLPVAKEPEKKRAKKEEPLSPVAHASMTPFASPPSSQTASPAKFPHASFFASSPPFPRAEVNHPPQFVPGVGVMANVAPDGPKREGITELIERKEWETAIKCHSFIINPRDDDFRQAVKCHEAIGKKQADEEGDFVKALMSYKEALLMNTYMVGGGDEDKRTRGRLSKACIDTLNMVASKWYVNFTETCTVICQFLDFYLTRIRVLKIGLNGAHVNLGMRNAVENHCAPIINFTIAIFQSENKWNADQWAAKLKACNALKGFKNELFEQAWHLFERACSMVDSLETRALMAVECVNVLDPKKSAAVNDAGSTASRSSPSKPFRK